MTTSAITDLAHFARTMQQAPTYVFDNADGTAARQRFNALDALYTARSLKLMAACGLATGWRCLEIGGGSGEVAIGLATRVGPSGSVIMTDIDMSLADRGALACHPQIILLAHDIVRDKMPDGRFDLIHARLVLSHLPARRQVLEHLVARLAPGGWIMIEEFDPVALDRTILLADGEGADLFRQAFGALGKVMRGHGYDPAFARSLPELFDHAGLVDISMDVHTSVRESGSPEAQLDIANLMQVRSEIVEAGLLPRTTIDTAITRLAAPGNPLLGPLMISAMGRKAGTVERIS